MLACFFDSCCLASARPSRGPALLASPLPIRFFGLRHALVFLSWFVLRAICLLRAFTASPTFPRRPLRSVPLIGSSADSNVLGLLWALAYFWRSFSAGPLVSLSCQLSLIFALVILYQPRPPLLPLGLVFFDWAALLRASFLCPSFSADLACASCSTGRFAFGRFLGSRCFLVSCIIYLSVLGAVWLVH